MSNLTSLLHNTHLSTPKQNLLEERREKSKVGITVASVSCSEISEGLYFCQALLAKQRVVNGLTTLPGFVFPYGGRVRSTFLDTRCYVSSRTDCGLPTVDRKNITVVLSILWGLSSWV